MTVDVPYTKSTNIDTLQEDKQTDQKTTASQGQITQESNISWLLDKVSNEILYLMTTSKSRVVYL